MIIILKNTPKGDICCTSITEAEKESMFFTNNTTVKVTNNESDLLFSFDPSKEGILMALNRVNQKIEESKLSIE